MNLVKCLQSTNLFHFLDNKILQEIIEKSATVMKINAGKQIFFQGDAGENFYIVLEGMVRISNISEKGKEYIIRDMQPGDSVAELILFEKDKYPATATAIMNSQVLRIEKKTFKEFLQNKDILDAFINNLIKKIHYLKKQFDLLNSAEVHDRFFHFLEVHYGKNETVQLTESKKEIAQMIGTIPETMSRMIHRLKKDNTIISWNKNQLVLRKKFWNEYKS